MNEPILTGYLPKTLAELSFGPKLVQVVPIQHEIPLLVSCKKCYF